MVVLWLGAASGCVIDDGGLTGGRRDASDTGTTGQSDAQVVETSTGGAGGATAGDGSAAGSAGVGVTDGAGGSRSIDVRDVSSTDGAGGNAGASGAGGASGASGAAGAGGIEIDSAADNAGTGGAAGAAGSNDGAVEAGGNDGGPDGPIATGAVFSVGSFVKSADLGSQVVPHALGQAPKALFLWTAGKTNETLSSGFYYGIGISDGATSVALAMSTRDTVATASSSRRIASKIMTLVQAGEITIAEADLASASASSITLNWTVNDGQPYVIHYLAIGGADVAAKIVNWQAPPTTGLKAITGIGFEPEAVLHFHVGPSFTSAVPSSQSNGLVGMGVMNKAGAQWAVQIADVAGVNPSIATRAQRTDAAIYMYHGPTPTLNKAASFVSMDPTGFTLNFTTASADASQVVSLALAGIQSSVGTFTKSTAVAPSAQAVATSFTPGAVFLSSYQIGPQMASVRESQCSWGIGAGDGINEASSAIVADDATSPTDVDAIDKTSKVFLKMNTAPLDAEADLVGFDPTGFTLNWTTNDPVASQMCFLALGKKSLAARGR